LESQLAAVRDHSLTLNERAELSCRLAKKLEKTGEYESACEALNEFWSDRYQPPRLEELDEPTQADLLLRVGALAGWQGDADQAEGSQESAKNLITRSLTLFQELGNPKGEAEAYGELGLCYWREGAYDEARIQLRAALHVLPEDNDQLRAVLLIRSGIVEVWTQRLNEALRFYNEAIPLVELSDDHALKGSFHFEYGLFFRRLSAPENREDYLDRALIEYAASSFHYEQAGNARALARVETNLGYLFFTIGRYDEAHKHLNRARYLFLELRDIGTAAKVDETRARTLLAEGRVVDAERTVRSAVRTLQKGGEQAVIAEALTTHATALARLGNGERARSLFEQAIEVSRTAGDLEGAGRARLSMIEELGSTLPLKEVISGFRSAIELLKGSHDPAAAKRLISCAATLLEVLGRSEAEDQESPEPAWESFSFTQYVREAERTVIERALRDAGGSVTRAARLLGLSHQTLIYLINSRHKKLLDARSAVRKRRRHIFSKPKKATKKVQKFEPKRVATQVTILHVEDNEMVAKLVGEMLAAEHWQVELCVDSDSALRKLFGNDHYDVLVIDNDLPGLSGLELVQRARKISHRRRTPIIMLSGDDCEKEAWRAGAKAFLRKPEGVAKISATITRLLEEQKERTD
jgi:CheY-like chemotaxis protein/tetratricopeptide (TPR) repeat protein